MNKNLVVCSLMTLAGAAVAEPTVEAVLLRQNWPWDRNVRVEYRLSGATAPVDLAVTVTSEGETYDTAKVRLALTDGSLWGATDGLNSFTFDPKTLFTSAKAKREMTVNVSVLGATDPLLNRVEYRVCDIATGSVKDLTRRDIYENPAEYGEVITDYASVGEGYSSPLASVFIATGFTNEIYKTEKLVLKRIPAQNVEWTFGSADDDQNRPSSDWNFPRLGECEIPAKFSKDYFIGVYELTQDQYFRVTGKKPSFYSNPDWWTTRPVENVSFNDFMAETGFAAQATARFGKMVTLPTEAQWEFAARAGTDGKTMPNGKSWSTESIAEIENAAKRGHIGDPSRDYANAHGVDGGGTYTCGRGKPNAYGLYDTLANVSEWTRDQPVKVLTSLYTSFPVVDPEATTWNLASGYRVYKGGCFNTMDDVNSVRPVSRFANQDTSQGMNNGVKGYGFRVMMPVD